jgi:uncharacterized SAM-binding protein YcdF (DUF218 family)
LRRAIRVCVAGVLALALAWTAGFMLFAANLPREVADESSRTDAIVVLTGGSGRVDEGLSLLAQGRAERLFISGVYRGVAVADLLHVSEAAPQDLACCLVLGYEAGSTQGNAVETAAWAAAEQVGSLRLVTASYHMPRSLLEFRRTMPQVEIVPHPVFPAHVRQRDWWRWPGSAYLLAREYTKFLGAKLRALVSAPALTPGRT